MRMYGRREKLSPEQTAANAKARAERARATMTCQCCAKRYLANTGTVAHHGYQRPGGGWQTASCSGAKALPFEVSRASLGALIVRLTRWKAESVEIRAAIEAETMPIGLIISDRTQRRDAYGRYPSKLVYITRETFGSVKADNAAHFTQNSLYDFDDIKDRDLAHRAREIKGVTEEIAAQQARFDGWAQTHDWDAAAKVWSPLRKEG